MSTSALLDYEVSRETGLVDYDSIERQALELKPLILLAAFPVYPNLDLSFLAKHFL